MLYDLVIVGMGPAGVTSAIYAKRAGLNVLCLDGAMIGGYLNYIDRIDNYPGLYGISGPDFAFKLWETVKELDIPYINERVDSIIKKDDIFKISTKNEVYDCKNVILAIGREMRKLGLDKEDELVGKGVSRCALCDGHFYKDKDVVVVGGGNSALQEALYLSNLCSKVTIIYRGNKFRATNELVDKVVNNDKINIIYNANVNELVTNNDVLKSVKLDNGEELETSGLFIYIGFIPNTKWLSNLNVLDSDGYILVDEKQETKVSGLYAIGDCVKKDIYQISNAVGEGTIAISQIINKIK